MTLRLKENICSECRLPRSDAVVMGRAELLSDADRDLVEAVLIDGQRVDSVARMIGVSARAIRWRLHRIGQRLTSRRFLDAGRALPYLSGDDRAIARMWFCEGVTQRQIARRFNMTRHALRRRLDRIAAQVETIRRIHAKDRPDRHEHT